MLLELKTVAQLDALLLYYSSITQDSNLKHLRFGQFIFNVTGVETKRSYNATDINVAYNSLLNLIEGE